MFAGCNLSFFLSTMAVLEGSDPKEKLESTYWTALTKNWMVWPWVQIVNFKFVPLQHRVLVVNVISLGECQSSQARKGGIVCLLIQSLGWNCYLSFLNSQGKCPPNPAEAPPS